jgi:imidazolonepropionase-like amidohydrolase
MFGSRQTSRFVDKVAGRLRSGPASRAAVRWAAVLAVLALGVAPAMAAPGPADEAGFADVNVLDVERGVVLPHRDVEVVGGVIRSITPARAGGSRRAGWIDGRGRYLLPGFIDLHAHLNERVRAAATAPTLVLSDEEILSPAHLNIFLAHGVTTLQVMHGAPEMLRLRDRISAGDATGPRLVVGSPRLDGLPPSDPFVRIAVTAAEGSAFVDEVKAAGYDFIKIYDGLNAETYPAVVTRAHELGLRVDGHLARELPIERSLEHGQDHVAHVEEFASFAPGLNDEDVARLTAQVKRSGVGVTPTLSVFAHVLRSIAAPGEALADPEMAYVDPLIYALWQPDRNPYRSERFQSPKVRARLVRQYQFMRALTVSFARAGVPLAVGTDCNVAGAAPGFSFHEEMQTLVDAGLTPAEVLRMATLNGAVALRLGDQLGSVAVGKMADLVLLEANPVSDIRNTRRIGGVMVRGRWMPAPELKAGVDLMRARFNALEPRLHLPVPRPQAAAGS